MKTIWEGLTYNTDTAEYIASRKDRGIHLGSDYEDSKFYKTKSGRFFVAGDFGWQTLPGRKLMSKYGYFETYWEYIVPLTTEEAKAWMSKICDTDAYIEAFGEPEEA